MIVALRREDDVAFASFEDVLGAVGSDENQRGQTRTSIRCRGVRTSTNTLLRLVIRDDGVGGAGRGEGSGLTGLVDRVEALGGKMTIQSQPGSGTSLLVNIPLNPISRRRIRPLHMVARWSPGREVAHLDFDSDGSRELITMCANLIPYVVRSR